MAGREFALVLFADGRPAFRTSYFFRWGLNLARARAVLKGELIEARRG